MKHAANQTHSSKKGQSGYTLGTEKQWEGSTVLAAYTQPYHEPCRTRGFLGIPIKMHANLTRLAVVGIGAELEEHK